jgi:hypothetical protein
MEGPGSREPTDFEGVLHRGLRRSQPGFKLTKASLLLVRKLSFDALKLL